MTQTDAEKLAAKPTADVRELMASNRKQSKLSESEVVSDLAMPDASVLSVRSRQGRAAQLVPLPAPEQPDDA